VRPHGRDVPATPLLVDALEQMARSRRARATVPRQLLPLQGLLRRAGVIALNRRRRRARALASQKRRPSPPPSRATEAVADVPTTKAG